MQMLKCYVEHTNFPVSFTEGQTILSGVPEKVFTFEKFSAAVLSEKI